MSFRFKKGIEQDSKHETIDEFAEELLSAYLESDVYPSSKLTENRKFVSLDVTQNLKYQIAPPPPEIDSKVLADDYIKIMELALKRVSNEELPEELTLESIKSDVNIGAYTSSFKSLLLEVGTEAYGLSEEEYLKIQNGGVVKEIGTQKPKSIKTYGDLAAFVHNDKDQLYQHMYFLFRSKTGHHPQFHSDNNDAFHNFVNSAPYACYLMSKVLYDSLRFAWVSKYKYMMIRPEVYGNILEVTPERLSNADYIKESEVGKKYYEKFKTFRLALAYPEGSPQHPSYPQGHQSVSTGQAIVLKYLLDTDQEIKEGYTVQDEINKMMDVVALGRVVAGVHYHCDYYDVIKAAEKNAVISISEINKEYLGDAYRPRLVVGYYGDKYFI